MPFNTLSPASAAAAPVTTAGAALTSVGETLASLQATLLEELSSRTDATTPRLTRWINFAYRQCCGMLDLPELWATISFSLVADQYLYLYPVGLGWVKEFSVIDSTTYGDTVGGIKLRPIALDLYRTLDDLTDEPRMWFQHGRMAVFYPTPLNARTAVADVKIRPVDLSAATDSPIIGSEFHEGIMLMAKARAFRQFRLYAESKEAMNDALTIIRPLTNTAAEQNANIPGTLTPFKGNQSMEESASDEFYRGSRW